MNCLISDAAFDDIDEVMVIETDAHPNHHWSKNAFENELSNNLAIYKVARNKEGRMMGYLGFWQILEEAHITTLAVHSDFKRMKVATNLLFSMIDKCYELMIKYITLEVRESNIPAIALYEKFGFTTIGKRKRYYQDNNEDALIMFTENIWYEKFKNNYKKLKDEDNNV